MPSDDHQISLRHPFSAVDLERFKAVSLGHFLQLLYFNSETEFSEEAFRKFTPIKVESDGNNCRSCFFVYSMPSVCFISSGLSHQLSFLLGNPKNEFIGFRLLFFFSVLRFIVLLERSGNSPSIMRASGFNTYKFINEPCFSTANTYRKLHLCVNAAFRMQYKVLLHNWTCCEQNYCEFFLTEWSLRVIRFGEFLQCVVFEIALHYSSSMTVVSFIYDL